MIRLKTRRAPIAFVTLAAALLWSGALVPTTWAGATPTRDLARPQLANLLDGSSVRDRVLSPGESTFAFRTATAGAPAGWWGGPVTTATGVPITLYHSDYYRVDLAAQQSWAGYFEWLNHGAELSGLTVFFAPLAQVYRMCGVGALGCYSPVGRYMIVPGDRNDGASMEQVIAHEYGHHIASNRDNAPWFAGDWGPKRWASYEAVCQRVQTGTAFPGDEGERYSLNPGEAFADSYRMLIIQRAGSFVSGWGAVMPFGFDLSFTPDSVAFGAINEDIYRPWSGPTGETWNGTFLKRRKTFVRIVRTPNDGIALIRLTRAPSGGTITLTDPATGVVVATSRNAIAFTVCGQESLGVRVSARFRGSFNVQVAVP